MLLNLGVDDLPYSEFGEGIEMTGEVATKLEKNYGVMGFFVKTHEKDIMDALGDGLVDALESAAVGTNVDISALIPAYAKIEHKFRLFIANKEMDGIVGGVPTKASLEGRSLRFAGKSRKTATRKKVRDHVSRPSFDDTGLYLRSFRVWAEE